MLTLLAGVLVAGSQSATATAVSTSATADTTAYTTTTEPDAEPETGPEVGTTRHYTGRFVDYDGNGVNGATIYVVSNPSSSHWRSLETTTSTREYQGVVQDGVFEFSITTERSDERWQWGGLYPLDPAMSWSGHEPRYYSDLPAIADGETHDYGVMKLSWKVKRGVMRIKPNRTTIRQDSQRLRVDVKVRSKWERYGFFGQAWAQSDRMCGAKTKAQKVEVSQNGKFSIPIKGRYCTGTHEMTVHFKAAEESFLIFWPQTFELEILPPKRR